MASISDLLTSKKGFNVDIDSINYTYEPLVTGYFLVYIKWPKIFDYMLTYDNNNTVISDTKTKGRHALIRDIISIDLPNYAIQVEPFTTGRMFRTMIPMSPDISQTINITYYESKNLLLFTLFDLWSNLIFNTTQHIPLIDLSKTNKSFQSLIKSSLYVIILDETYLHKDVKDYIFAFKFLGIMPTNIQNSSFGTNIENNELMKSTVTFSYDMLISNGPYADAEVKFIPKLDEQIRQILQDDSLTEIDKYEKDIKDLVDKIKYYVET